MATIDLARAHVPMWSVAVRSTVRQVGVLAAAGVLTAAALAVTSSLVGSWS